MNCGSELNVAVDFHGLWQRSDFHVYNKTFDYCFNCPKHSQLTRQDHETLSFVPRLTGWFFQRLVYGGYLPPPHSLRQAQGCGFPHTQAAKKTAPSRQSLKKRFHGLARQENSRQKTKSIALRTAKLWS
jgi:hypothetical protein